MQGTVDLVGFYDISTIVGYLMPSPLYTYIKYMICKQILLITFLEELELFFAHMVKWFQVFLCNTNNSINYESFVCTKINGFMYCDVTETIQLNSHFFTQLNGQTILFLPRLFNVSHLFAHSLNVNQRY